MARGAGRAGVGWRAVTAAVDQHPRLGGLRSPGHLAGSGQWSVPAPLEETLADTLAWEMQSGPGRPRRAGLSPADERTLLALARG